jgi:hypothetical protein
MSFDAEEWLAVADICCGNIPGISRQALLRTALNRAYYAALMVLKFRIDAAQGMGTVPEWRTHDALKQAVRTGGPAFEDMSESLEELRQMREMADYVLGEQQLGYDSARRAIRIARWLIRNRIKALPDAEFRRLHVARG